MSKITQALTGGIAGTALMTGWMMIAPKLGFMEMSPAEMMAGMMGTSVMVGWAVHFMIGIIFAIAYTMLIINWLGKISNNILKGAVFGVIVWIVANAVMMIMGAMVEGMAPPEPEGSSAMMMMVIGTLLNHIVYGIGVSFFVKAEE